MRGGDRTRTGPRPDALEAWPAAPEAFTPAERRAFAELGAALLPLGVVCASDVLLARRAAQISARVDVALADAKLKTSTLASLLRLEGEVLARLGIGPAARRGVDALPSREDEPARGSWGPRRRSRGRR